MTVSPLTSSIATPIALRTSSTQAQATPVQVQDTVSLQATPSASQEKRKAYRAVAWAGFGVEMVGGALTLLGHPGIGFPLFLAGTGGIVYGEYKAARA